MVILMMREKLLRDRYLQSSEKTENEMYARVARFIAKGDPEYERQLYESMRLGIWLPNSPTLANAGIQGAGGLSACYVLPIEDSLDGIYRTVWHAARVHKYFGGTGFNFSGLRKRGALISSTKGKACGPVKVMELLNESAGVVSQGGKREGANMGILNADHPDIEEFISCKDSGSGLTHFNISVGLTDEDMRSRNELVARIAEHAHRTGDPGVIFLDRLNEGNRFPERGLIDCTNPCGEQPLRPFESCNLASINLGTFATTDDFDYRMLTDTVQMSVRALNDIIDLNSFPIPEIQKATLLSRKIGSGVMGWADTLIKLGIPYQSNEALTLIESIGRSYREQADVTSLPFHNETVMTIAPTGTLSFLAECSSGIEPVFDWIYTRESESGIVTVEHKLHGLAKEQGLLEDTAKNISVEWQIKHMAAWQAIVDNAVSKTVNLPKSATIEDIEQAIRLAWKMKCKGVTVYRDGSKDRQVLTSVNINTKVSGKRVERYGRTLDFPTGCGEIHVTTNNNLADDHPYEAYVLTQGGCKANMEGMGKVISKYIHDPRLYGDEATTIKRIIATLSKVECTTAIKNPNSAGKSCPDILAKRMRAFWFEDVQAPTPVQTDRVCPQCGTPVTFGSGCRNGSCLVCGWSGCS